MKDRALGLLLGLAAGDRNGGPVRMAVRLGESLAERRAFDPDDILARYVQWWREGAFDTGPVTWLVLKDVAEGADPAQAVRQVAATRPTAGVGPAHRCSPLALAPFLDDEALQDAARREAALTHGDPEAGEVAAQVVLLARRLLRGEPWERRPTRNFTPGGYAPEVLAAALHFLDRGRTFPEALRMSLDYAGPANYCPVLVGALGGARWGASEVTGLDGVDPALLARLARLATG